ncbi:MAG: cytochrome c [Pseudomonadota bacterium]
MSKNPKTEMSGTAGVVAGLALWLAVAACASQPAHQPPQQAQLAQALAAPDRPGAPEPLAPAARALLRDRMAAHARGMGDLMAAIMLLEYDQIASRADDVAADVNLSRPITNDATELNAQIPEKFFVRQDDLKAAAHTLADAARTQNPYKVADAYGRLSETCVRCHADFRPAGPSTMHAKPTAAQGGR